MKSYHRIYLQIFLTAVVFITVQIAVSAYLDLYNVGYKSVIGMMLVFMSTITILSIFAPLFKFSSDGENK